MKKRRDYRCLRALKQYFAAITATYQCPRNDEVIDIEPAYDLYVPLAFNFGGGSSFLSSTE